MNGYHQRLQSISELGLQRTLQETLPTGNGHCQFNGKSMLNLSSNDYLGLQVDNDFKKRFIDQLDPRVAYFTGSGSSRLLTGNSPLYSQFERAAKEWMNCSSRDVLLYNSGYHANVGILPALCDKGDLIVSDKLCHASLQDGIRLSAAAHVRFRHNDFDQLEYILSKKRNHFQRVFIVVESLYSMDGDFTDVSRLLAIKKRFDVMLYVDEAHSIGVFGDDGRGVVASQGGLDDVDVLVCPMGKALASQGAMVVSSSMLSSILLNTSRTLLFTTALPPINIAWSLFVIENMRSFSDKRDTLQELQQLSNSCLAKCNLPVSDSYIIPIVVGDNRRATQLTELLRARDVLVFPIRPPTVAVNTSRLRISLTADLPAAELIDAIEYACEYVNLSSME